MNSIGENVGRSRGRRVVALSVGLVVGSSLLVAPVAYAQDPPRAPGQGELAGQDHLNTQEQRRATELDAKHAETYLALRNQGLECGGGRCTSENKIEHLNLRDLDVSGIEFHNLKVNSIDSTGSNMSDSSMVNLEISGTWASENMNASRLKITQEAPNGAEHLRPGQTRSEPTKLTLNWSNANAQNIEISNANLHGSHIEGGNWAKAEVVDGALSGEMLVSLYKQGAREFGGNAIGQQSGGQGGEALPAGTKLEGVVLNGSSLRGDLTNVELINSRLHSLKAEGAQDGGANWKEVKISGGRLIDAQILLNNSENVKIDIPMRNAEVPSFQNVSIKSTGSSQNLKVSGTVNGLGLDGNFTRADVSGLTKHPRGNTLLSFTDVKLDNVKLPTDIRDSVMVRTTFVNTNFPENLNASGLSGRDVSIKGGEANNSFGKQPNFSLAEVRNLDLSGATLTDANFTRADLKDFSLEGATVRGTSTFNRAKLSNVQAANARIEGKVSFARSVWNTIVSWFSTAPKIAFQSATFSGNLDLSRASAKSLSNINWAGAKFSNTAEIVFNNPDVALDAISQVLLAQKGVKQVADAVPGRTSLLGNATISALDERGQKIELIKSGLGADRALERFVEIYYERSAMLPVKRDITRKTAYLSGMDEKISKLSTEIEALRDQIVSDSYQIEDLKGEVARLKASSENPNDLTPETKQRISELEQTLRRIEQRHNHESPKRLADALEKRAEFQHSRDTFNRDTMEPALKAAEPIFKSYSDTLRSHSSEVAAQKGLAADFRTALNEIHIQMSENGAAMVSAFNQLKTNLAHMNRLDEEIPGQSKRTENAEKEYNRAVESRGSIENMVKLSTEGLNLASETILREIATISQAKPPKNSTPKEVEAFLAKQSADIQDIKTEYNLKQKNEQVELSKKALANHDQMIERYKANLERESSALEQMKRDLDHAREQKEAAEKTYDELSAKAKVFEEHRASENAKLEAGKGDPHSKYIEDAKSREGIRQEQKARVENFNHKLKKNLAPIPEEPEKEQNLEAEDRAELARIHDEAEKKRLEQERVEKIESEQREARRQEMLEQQRRAEEERLKQAEKERIDKELQYQKDKANQDALHKQMLEAMKVKNK